MSSKSKGFQSGNYAYVCDGASPGSPVLSDGHAVYTPGLSESRGGTSSYAASDVLGNLWFMDNASAAQTYYQDATAFGSGQNMGIGGTEAGPFKFGGVNGCQTDTDTGLVLMGHRYYDTRIGRFITQDHAKSGGNWYAYCNNNPTNNTDPSGLTPMDGLGSSPIGSPGYMPNSNGGNGFGEDDSESYENNKQVDQNIADHAAAMLHAFLSAGVVTEIAGAPVITKPGKPGKVGDYILSMGYGAEVLLGTHKYTLSAGLAIDLSIRQFEVTGTFGHYNGIGLGSATGPYIGLGVGNLGGYNGFSSGYNADLGEYGGVAYDYNAGYKGITYSPSFLSSGLAAGAFMGIVGANNASRGGSFTVPVTTYHY